MELEPFLIESALTAVSAQRLARRICQTCIRPCEPTVDEVAEIAHRVKSSGIRLPDGLMKNLKRGSGCAACRQSGYSGRVLDGLRKAAGGITSISEVFRVVDSTD